MSIFGLGKGREDDNSKASSQSSGQAYRQPGPGVASNVVLSDAERTAQRMAIQAASRKRMNSDTDYSIKGGHFGQAVIHHASTWSTTSDEKVQQSRRGSKDVKVANTTATNIASPRQLQKKSKTEKKLKKKKPSGSSVPPAITTLPDSRPEEVLRQWNEASTAPPLQQAAPIDQVPERASRPRGESSTTMLLQTASLPDHRPQNVPSSGRETYSTMTSRSTPVFDQWSENPSRSRTMDDGSDTMLSHTTVVPQMPYTSSRERRESGSTMHSQNKAPHGHIRDPESQKMRMTAQERGHTRPELSRDSGYDSAGQPSGPNSRSPSDTRSTQEAESYWRQRKINASLPRQSLSEEITNDAVPPPQPSEGKKSARESATAEAHSSEPDSANYVSRLDPGRVSSFLNDSTWLSQTSSKPARTEQPVSAALSKPLKVEQPAASTTLKQMNPQQPAAPNSPKQVIPEQPLASVPPKTQQPKLLAASWSSQPSAEVASKSVQDKDSPTLGHSATMGHVVPSRQRQPATIDDIESSRPIVSNDRSSLPSQTRQLAQDTIEGSERSEAIHERGALVQEQKSHDVSKMAQILPTLGKRKSKDMLAQKSKVSQIQPEDSAQVPQNKPEEHMPLQARFSKFFTRQSRDTAPQETNISEPATSQSQTPSQSQAPSPPAPIPATLAAKASSSSLKSSTSRPIEDIAIAGPLSHPNRPSSNDTRSVAESKASSSDEPKAAPRLPSLSAMSGSSQTRTTDLKSALAVPSKSSSTRTAGSKPRVQIQEPAQSAYALSPTETQSPQRPPISVLEGFRVNRRGKVLDEEGELLGELVYGEVIDCVRQRINAQGEVINEHDSVIGVVRTVPRTTGSWPTSTPPQHPFVTPTNRRDSLQRSMSPVGVSNRRQSTASQSAHEHNQRHLRVQEHLASRISGIIQNAESATQQSNPSNTFIAELDASEESQSFPVIDHSEIFAPFANLKAPASTESLKKSSESVHSGELSISAPQQRRDSESNQSDVSLDFAASEPNTKRWTSRYFVNERSGAITPTSPVDADWGRRGSLLGNADTSAAVKVALEPNQAPLYDNMHPRRQSLTSPSSDAPTLSLLPASHHEIVTHQEGPHSHENATASNTGYTDSRHRQLSPSSAGTRYSLTSRGSYHAPLRKSPLSSIPATPPKTPTTEFDDEYKLQPVHRNNTTTQAATSRPRSIFGQLLRSNDDNSSSAKPAPATKKAETPKKSEKRKSLFGLPLGKKEQVVVGAA